MKMSEGGIDIDAVQNMLTADMQGKMKKMSEGAGGTDIDAVQNMLTADIKDDKDE